MDGNARINMLLINKDQGMRNWLQYQKAVKDPETLMKHGILGDDIAQNELIMNRINSGDNWVLVKMIDEPVRQSEIMRMIRIANNPQPLTDNLVTLKEVWKQDAQLLHDASRKIHREAGDETSWAAIVTQADHYKKGMTSEVLRDRLARAAFIDLLGEDNLVLAHNLANHYTRNQDDYIQQLLEEVLLQYTNLKTLPSEARMLDVILEAADMVTRARMHFPTLPLEEVVETLISANNRWYSQSMSDNAVLTELMRLISRVGQLNYDKNISKAIAEYISILKSNVPTDNLTVEVVLTNTIVKNISGLQPE